MGEVKSGNTDLVLGEPVVNAWLGHLNCALKPHKVIPLSDPAPPLIRPQTGAVGKAEEEEERKGGRKTRLIT